MSACIGTSGRTGLCDRWRVTALAVIAILLGVLLAAAIAAIGVLAKQLAQAQAQVMELQDALDAEQRVRRVAAVVPCRPPEPR